MSDAPERMFACYAHDGRLLGLARDHVEFWQEYIRADIHAAEITRLRAKVDAADKLVAVAMECAFDLECYVEHEYGDVLHIPDMFRKYHRDMEPVTAFRRALTIYNEAGE